MALDATEVLTELTEIIADLTGLATSAIDPTKTFYEDLDMDALRKMATVTLAEDRFSVEIPDAAVKNLLTVGELADLIVAVQH